ncbi:hypothetical protein ACQ4LF_24765, partial [Aeromonas salmonicida]
IRDRAVYWGLTHTSQTPLLVGLLVIFSLRLLPGLLKRRVRFGPLPEWLWLCFLYTSSSPPDNP